MTNDHFVEVNKTIKKRKNPAKLPMRGEVTILLIITVIDRLKYIAVTFLCSVNYI